MSKKLTDEELAKISGAGDKADGGLVKDRPEDDSSGGSGGQQERPESDAPGSDPGNLGTN